MREIDGRKFSEEFKAEVGEHIKSSLKIYEGLSKKYNMPMSDILVYVASGTVYMASLAEESEIDDPDRLYFNE